MLGPAMSGIQRDMQGVKNDGNMRNKASWLLDAPPPRHVY